MFSLSQQPLSFYCIIRRGVTTFGILAKERNSSASPLFNILMLIALKPHWPHFPVCDEFNICVWLHMILCILVYAHGEQLLSLPPSSLLPPSLPLSSSLLSSPPSLPPSLLQECWINSSGDAQVSSSVVRL